jgi:hypothetical protein
VFPHLFFFGKDISIRRRIKTKIAFFRQLEWLAILEEMSFRTRIEIIAITLE